MASLLGKVWRYDPTAVCATDIYRSATEVGYAMLGLKGGRIEEGYLADLCLIDLKAPSMVPCHNLTSNLVYASLLYTSPIGLLDRLSSCLVSV